METDEFFSESPSSLSVKLLNESLPVECSPLPELQNCDLAELGEINDTDMDGLDLSQLMDPDMERFLLDADFDALNERLNAPPVERPLTSNTVDELMNISLRPDDSIETQSVDLYFVDQSSGAQVPEHNVDYYVTDDEQDDECKVMGIVDACPLSSSILRQHALASCSWASEHNYCKPPWKEGIELNTVQKHDFRRLSNNESCRKSRLRRKQRSEKEVALRKTLEIKNAALKAEIDELELQREQAYELLKVFSPLVGDKS